MLEKYRNAPNINTDYVGWLSWAKERKQQFEANCPYDRPGDTFYIDGTAADNSGDGLSPATAKRDLSEIATYAAANGGDLSGKTISITGGQRYVATGSVLNYTGDDLTIRSSNGTPAIIDRFSVEYSEADDDWGSQSGDRWQVSESTDIAWVKIRSDTYGEERGTHLIRVASAADCTTTDNSFFHDGSGDVLYINLAGDDPNDYTIDALPDNSDDGVSFAGDGCRLEGITFLGFGMNPSTTASQKQGATNRSSGDDANYYKNVGCYFSGSHAMAHYLDGSGGRSYWEKCHTGFCQYNSGSETIFNTYSRDGACESWSDGLDINYGTLKSNQWPYASEVARGSGVYGHNSSGDPLDLIVYLDTAVKESHTPCESFGAPGATPGFDVWDLSSCRVFYVRCVKEMPAGIGKLSLSSNLIYKNCQLACRPVEESTTDSTGTVRPNNCYYLDCALDFDLAAWAGGQFCWFNGSSGSRELHIANSSVIFINNNSTGNGRGLFDYDAQYAGYAGESGAQGSIVNSIIATDDPGSQGNFNLGFGNASNILINNAYYGIVAATGGSSTDKRGYAQDASAIELSAMPKFGVQYDEIVGAGSSKRISTHDINGRKRITHLPDVGPYDFRSRAVAMNELEAITNYIGQDITDRPNGLAAVSKTATSASSDALAAKTASEANQVAIPLIPQAVDQAVNNQLDGTDLATTLADKIASDWIAGDATPLAIVEALKADSQFAAIVANAAETVGHLTDLKGEGWNGEDIRSLQETASSNSQDLADIQGDVDTFDPAEHGLIAQRSATEAATGTLLDVEESSVAKERTAFVRRKSDGLVDESPIRLTVGDDNLLCAIDFAYDLSAGGRVASLVDLTILSTTATDSGLVLASATRHRSQLKFLATCVPGLKEDETLESITGEYLLKARVKYYGSDGTATAIVRATVAEGA